MVPIVLFPSETFFSVLFWAPGLPPLIPLLREYQFCPTSDTLPWVIEPDVESQSGDALLNAWHLVQIWRGLHYRYRLTSSPIPESPWGISFSVRGCVCFSFALPPNSSVCVKVGPPSVLGLGWWGVEIWCLSSLWYTLFWFGEIFFFFFNFAFERYQ